MANARELGHLFYNRKVIQDSDCIHLVDYYRKIVATSGAKTDEVEFLLPRQKEAEQQVEKLLMEHGVAKDNYAVLVPGSVRAEKCWPVEKYAMLADMMASDFGASVVVVGSQAEREITEQMKMRTKTTVADFVCLTSIPELITLMRDARIVISNDTGPGHIASALGVPTVLIFGPTNPARVAPYGKSGAVVAVDGDKRGSEVRSSEPRYNIEAIGVEQVYEKVCELLSVKHH